MIPPFLRTEAIEQPHAFFGRRGGVSTGIYASLNGSRLSGDDPGAVDENRRRMRETLGGDALLTARQTHSANAVFVDRPWEADEAPEADALVTATPGLAVAVLTADCVPILLAGSELVAAVHAGWRGSLRGIVEATVSLMAKLGAETRTLRAAIGPHLRRASFEVENDLIDEVTASFPDARRFFTPAGERKSLYDHTAFVRERLEEAGIASPRIHDLGGDTLSEPETHHSYRGVRRQGHGRCGHNVAAIVARKS